MATLRDLRDRALIATLTYFFARITAVLKMRPRGAGWTILIKAQVLVIWNVTRIRAMSDVRDHMPDRRLEVTDGGDHSRIETLLWIMKVPLPLRSDYVPEERDDANR
jgi:hypothetical protein